MLHGQCLINAFSEQAALLVLEAEDSSLLELDLPCEAEAGGPAVGVLQQILAKGSSHDFVTCGLQCSMRLAGIG